MKLGSYELLDEIGRGGLGAVFRARAPDGRMVAIKVLLKPGAGLALERFERERRLLAEAGDGFVGVLDTGSSPQGPYLVMPLLEGGTLRQRLTRGGKLPAPEAVALGLKLASSLARAHAKGIV
ncbi:MAG: protein kinase, partial [Planctomycetota bacterium]